MRKRIVFYFAFICLLSAFQCNEEEYKPDNLVESNNLIEIEDSKSTFLVDEYIFIQTEIKNQQTTIDNETVNLNDFIVGNSVSLAHYLSLFKLSSENERIPYFVENVEELKGTIDFNNENSFFYITSVYDEDDDSFSSKIGIKLSEPGSYLLIPDTFTENRYKIIFDLNGSASVGSLQLNTSILDSDDEGIYRFIVE